MPKRTRAASRAEDEASPAPATGQKLQVAFRFRAALWPDLENHILGEGEPEIVTGELVVWMTAQPELSPGHTAGKWPKTSPHHRSMPRRRLLPHEEVGGHYLHDGSCMPITGRISGPKEAGRNSRSMTLSIGAMKATVCPKELDTWEENEGGKLVLSDAGSYPGDFWSASDIIIMFTTLSAAPPAAALTAATPAPVKRRALSRRSHAAPTPAPSAAPKPNWPALERAFLGRYFAPLRELFRDCPDLRQHLRGPSKGMTHVHLRSGHVHDGRNFAARAVEAYVQFLRLKVSSADFGGGQFSPTRYVDEVWHTHMQAREHLTRRV